MVLGTLLICVFCSLCVDVHHEKFDENDHDYNKNMNDLGQSLAQTSIKDEPRQSFQNDRTMLDQSSYTTSNITASSASNQSALVQLLTANRQLNPVKREDHQNSLGFTGYDINDGTSFLVIFNHLQYIFASAFSCSNCCIAI